MRPDIVVVCTANEARSPLLHVRLQAQADEAAGADVTQGPALAVVSAGTEARFGAPAAPGSIEVARRWGLDLTEHRAQPVAAVAMTEAALVVVMTRRHARDVLDRWPALAGRVWPLRPLVTAAASAAAPPGATPSADRVPDTAGATDQGTDRSPSRLALEQRLRILDDLRTGRGRRREDVPDPVRSGQDAYDALGVEFDAAAHTLTPLLFGAAQPGQ
ncbi:MAG: hypothetical protein JJT89_01040 [Nitriliruptoraceae bacterium]|nr:hypothetical protein [Nitriliruptoraceae bacterium]